MAEITREQVKDLAKLARLGLSEAEEESLAREMTAILDFVGELDKIKIDDMAATSQVTGLQNVMEEDRKLDCGIKQEELFSNVPDKEDGFIRVKKVLE